MKLNADLISGAESSKTYAPKHDGLSALQVADIIHTWQQSLGNSGIKKVTHIQSSLVAGIGFINLYKVLADGITDLAQLKLADLKRVKLGVLDAELAEGLREFLGDISEHGLYLLEYPDGFILTLNEKMLAFSPRWP